VPDSRNSSCELYSLIIDVCLGVFFVNMRTGTCVVKVININEYKQNGDNITCNIKIEMQIDVHIDVKQARN